MDELFNLDKRRLEKIVKLSFSLPDTFSNPVPVKDLIEAKTN